MILRQLVGVTFFAAFGFLLATPGAASGQIIMADFNSNTGVFTVSDGASSSQLANGALTVMTTGGFKNILHDSFLPRTGTSTPNAELTASDLAANPFIEWDWRSDDAGSSGDFIGNHLVFNTDVNGLNYKVLQDSFSFIPPNADTTGTHTYDVRRDAAGFSALQDWIAGEGTYFQIFVVQQTTDNQPSVVHYGEFRAVPEPGTGLALAAFGTVLLAKRRRRR